MQDDLPTIHIRIRELRRERALTQEELAGALGISRQSVNAMEAGRCLPSLPVAMQIASFFAVPLTAFLEAENARVQAEQQLSTSNQEEDTMSQLVPWSPLREMREALDELMDESVNWQAGPQAVVPAVNVSQTEKEVEVELNLPGYQKDQLSIEVGNDFVTISGEAQTSQKDEGKQYFRREFASRSFQRMISLPAIVESDKAEAEMKHGVLRITIPKVVEEKPKTSKISIKSGE